MPNIKKIKIRVFLGEDFNDQVENIVYDSMKKAQEKWGLSCDDEQFSLVVQNSYQQLKRKVSEVYKAQIDDIEEDESVIRPDLRTIHSEVKSAYHSLDNLVIDLENGNISVNGNQSEADEAGNLLLRKTSSAGYEVEKEESDKTVWLYEFDDNIRKNILKWAEAAVFYGVGSFK